MKNKTQKCKYCKWYSLRLLKCAMTHCIYEEEKKDERNLEADKEL